MSLAHDLRTIAMDIAPDCPDVETLNQAADELDRLNRWKAEALVVLSEWEDVWVAAGRPGELGRSKAAGVFDLVRHGTMNDAVARYVADYWRQHLMSMANDTTSAVGYQTGAHALCMVLAALDGETRPEHLGVGPDGADQINAITGEAS